MSCVYVCENVLYSVQVFLQRFVRALFVAALGKLLREAVLAYSTGTCTEIVRFYFRRKDQMWDTTRHAIALFLVIIMSN